MKAYYKFFALIGFLAAALLLTVYFTTGCASPGQTADVGILIGDGVLTPQEQELLDSIMALLTNSPPEKVEEPAPPVTEEPEPAANPDPDPTAPQKAVYSSLLKESATKNEQGQVVPSGRGAVFVLTASWLRQIQSVVVGGVAFKNATNYTELQNGAREHWRYGAQAQKFHGQTVVVTLKNGDQYAAKINGSGGSLYRADLNFSKVAGEAPTSNPPASEAPAQKDLLAIGWDGTNITVPSWLAFTKVVCYKVHLDKTYDFLWKTPGTKAPIGPGWGEVQVHGQKHGVLSDLVWNGSGYSIKSIYHAVNEPWPYPFDTTGFVPFNKNDGSPDFAQKYLYRP